MKGYAISKFQASGLRLIRRCFSAFNIELSTQERLEATMDARILIRAIGRQQRALLARMYERFDPLGAAFGLPPPADAARQSWIRRALDNTANFAAFSPHGEIVGHCFLVPDNSESAELAVFVQKENRRAGVATALVDQALVSARAMGLRRVWSVTPSENRAALRLQLRCGFHAGTVSTDTEMKIDLLLTAGRETL